MQEHFGPSRVHAHEDMEAGAELCQALFQLLKLCQQYLYSDGRWVGGRLDGWFNCDYIAKPQLRWIGAWCSISFRNP